MNRGVSMSGAEPVRKQAPARRALPLRPAGAVAVLFLLLVASVTAATAIGVVQLPLFDALRVIVVEEFAPRGGAGSGQASIVWTVRLPRGARRRLGRLCPGYRRRGDARPLRNPLAEPGIVGVSAGGSMGAVIAIFLELQRHSVWAVPAAAFAGALFASWLAYALATRSGKTETATLLLAGVAPPLSLALSSRSCITLSKTAFCGRSSTG